MKRGNEVGCEVVQLFTKSSRRWAASEITEEDRGSFAETREELDVEPVMVHMAYLINLAKGDEEAREKSFDSFVTEIQRAELLDIPTICFHPGSHLGDGPEKGIERAADCVKRAIPESDTENVRVLFENMAGQGTNIGDRFEHLRDLMEAVDMPDRTGICLDTAHLHAAGYDLSGEGYEETMEEFDEVVGMEHLYGWHLNDTEEELGSNVDRHHHIGKGEIGEGPFEKLVTDSRFDDVPGVIETPKEDDWDEKNISLLKSLRDGD